MQARGLSANDVANALAAQNLLTPAGTQKIGGFEYAIQLNNAPTRLRGAGRPAGVRGQRRHGLSARRRAGARRQPAADQHRPCRRQPLGAAAGAEERRGLDARRSSTASSSGSRSCSKTLPDNVSIAILGDQSLFVEGAIGGVAVEAVIAAVLTSLMILLFLGSWRSTVIIATSDPARHPGLDRRCSRRSARRSNIMTLGGLALAVGILVDDATVTIENINWHLEQGKEVETGDHGRRAADRDAGLRLAALHLHRVRADVLPRGRRALPVRADGRGGDVRHDLLVHPVAHAGADDGELSAEAARRSRRTASKPPHRAIRWSSSSAASRRASSASARSIATCWRWRWRTARCSSAASWPSCWRRSCWRPSSAATSSRRSIPARS